MKLTATARPFRAISAVVVLLLIAVPGVVTGQATNTVAPPLPAPASEVEQLRSLNIRLQAQLREAELAIERNRAEAQEAARAQAAAITEKLNSIQTALDTERKRQQEELAQQREALQKSNRTLLWVAGTFGAFGVLALLYAAQFQWRMTSRIAEVTAIRAQLPAPPEHGLATTAGLPAKTVELSNQRLMTVIERLERRVFELENTAVKPLPAGEQEAVATTETGEANGRIAALLSKGQALLETENPDQAIACYDQILELHANHPEALVKKGAALERLKKDEEALRCYDQAIAADATLTIAYLYKGGIYNRLERYNDALECYEQALRAQGGTA